jgi:glucose/mannose transport system permease protein
MDYLFESGNLALSAAAATTMLITVIAVVVPWFYWQGRRVRGAGIA